MTKLVEQIYILAQQGSRAEQYAAINAILALLEEEDTSLSPAQIKELDRREALLLEGKMSVQTVDDAIASIETKLDKAS
ncbi:MAG: addiction module protein [Bacteroidota bacterium]